DRGRPDRSARVRGRAAPALRRRHPPALPALPGGAGAGGLRRAGRGAARGGPRLQPWTARRVTRNRHSVIRTVETHSPDRIVGLRPFHSAPRTRTYFYSEVME